MAEVKLDYGPIGPLMDDPDISEIMINGPGKVFAERKGKNFLTGISFSGDEEVLKYVEQFFALRGKRVGYDVPYCDVCTPDGTRINAIIPPLSHVGVSVTFRKFSKAINTIDDLIKLGTLDSRIADLLIACIKGKINMVFSGGTSTGKTTTLQILSNYFAPEERVVTVEDTAELRLIQPNVVPLETRTPDLEGKGGVTLRDLIRNALRMAPNRIIVGEVRGAEAIDMLQAMATGHSGTIGIIHGNTPKDVIARLETMVLMSGIELPLWEVRKLICSTVNLIAHHERLQDGSRKITYMTELRGIEREEIVFNDLFTWQFMKRDEEGRMLGTHKSTLKYYPLFWQKFEKMKLLDKNVFA